MFQQISGSCFTVCVGSGGEVVLKVSRSLEDNILASDINVQNERHVGR